MGKKRQFPSKNAVNIGKYILASLDKPQNSKIIRSGFLLFTPLEELRMQHPALPKKEKPCLKIKLFSYGSARGGAEPQLPCKELDQSGGLVPVW
jgi:hypothetical protein